MIFGVTTKAAGGGKATSSWLPLLGAVPQIVSLWEDVEDIIKGEKSDGVQTPEAIAQGVAQSISKTVPEVAAQYNVNGVDWIGWITTMAQMFDDGKITSAEEFNTAAAQAEQANRSPALTMLLVGAGALLLLPMLFGKGRSGFKRFSRRLPRFRRPSFRGFRGRSRRPRRSFRRGRR